MIYHLTYLSNGLKVKGYLSFPDWLELPKPELEKLIHQFYGSTELPVTQISSSINRDQKDIGSFKLPVLIYCRGGIGKVGRVKTHWIEQFANHGSIIFAPSYRGNEGGEGRDEFGGAEKEDVFSAYRFLQNLPFVDPKQISVMGFSRGSINATQTAVELPGVYRLILWSGVSDLAQTYEERVDIRRMLKRVIGGSPFKIPSSYHDRSPINLAERIHCPVLIIHGTEDIQVDFSHGLNMYNKLKELGRNVEMHRYESYGHHFPPPIHDFAVKQMFDWLKSL